MIQGTPPLSLPLFCPEGGVSLYGGGASLDRGKITPVHRHDNSSHCLTTQSLSVFMTIITICVCVCVCVFVCILFQPVLSLQIPLLSLIRVLGGSYRGDGFRQLPWRWAQQPDEAV